MANDFYIKAAKRMGLPAPKPLAMLGALINLEAVYQVAVSRSTEPYGAELTAYGAEPRSAEPAGTGPDGTSVLRDTREARVTFFKHNWSMRFALPWKEKTLDDSGN